MIPDLRASFYRQNWVRVKNASGAAIPPHSVVLRNGTVAVTDGEPVFSVIQPNSSSTQFSFDGYLVTGPFWIGADSDDEGIATELTTPGFVRYNGSTPTTGAVYGPKHGQLTLEQYYYGYLILGGSTTDVASNNVVVAKWIGVPSVLCKTDAQSTKGGAGITCSVWAGAVGSEADTSMDITGVGNLFASVGSGKYVWVTLNGGSPYITQTEKTVHTSLQNVRIKTGNTHIEGQDLDIFVDTVDTLAYTDQFAATECPP